MSPNVSSQETSENETKNPVKKDCQEILCNGYFYDITEFIDRHPGGNVIKFYTQHGEDATQAVEQFHYRARNKVETILKSLKKRKAGEPERGIPPDGLLRHEMLSRDFKKLFGELESEGYFEPSIPHVVLRILDAISLTLLAFGLFLQMNTIWAKCLCSIPCGFALSRFAWLMHEGGHNSLTGRPGIDKFIQAMCFCFTLGASHSWWNSQHNRHHAMPQRLQHDVDLATLPFLAFNKRTVNKSTQMYPFFIKYQALLFWNLDIFVTAMAWRFYLHPRHQWRKKAYFELLLAVPSICFYLFVMGPGWFCLSLYWMGFFLLTNFALSHSHLEVADKPTHWVEYSFTHTANITPSIFVDYYMGYLNYQIEHHLFPTMPQFRQKQICHRVKALAEKHGLPYRVFSYIEACKLALGNLESVGKELTKDY